MDECARHQQGFTVIEMLIAVSIAVIVGALILGTLSRFRSASALRQATDEAIGLLREAREYTLASKNERVWGVHFASTTLTLFSGGVYQSGASSNVVVLLPRTVEIDLVSLSTTTANVVFNRLTGESPTTGTVRFRSNTSGELRVVEIFTSGLLQTY